MQYDFGHARRLNFDLVRHRGNFCRTADSGATAISGWFLGYTRGCSQRQRIDSVVIVKLAYRDWWQSGFNLKTTFYDSHVLTCSHASKNKLTEVEQRQLKAHASQYPRHFNHFIVILVIKAEDGGKQLVQCGCGHSVEADNWFDTVVETRSGAGR